MLQDDDCEEGEIKEDSGRRSHSGGDDMMRGRSGQEDAPPGRGMAGFQRAPLCRFFVRGNCTWGTECRYLHPGVKG